MLARPSDPMLFCISAIEDPGTLSIRYRQRLAQVAIEPSVGNRRDSYDNASSSSFAPPNSGCVALKHYI